MKAEDAYKLAQAVYDPERIMRTIKAKAADGHHRHMIRVDSDVDMTKLTSYFENLNYIMERTETDLIIKWSKP